MMKKTIKATTIVAFILFLSSAVFSQDFAGITKSNFATAKGVALYDNGRYKEAVVPFKKAIKIRPAHGRAHYYLALTYEKLKDIKKAIDLLSPYLDYVKQTKEWVGKSDKEYIVKCERLLNWLISSS
jgi:tetratricopeptide (TPR) repeat protein